MALTITVNITDAEQLCLLNDLLDIEDWVQKAVKGKISQCRKRMIREWQPKLFNDPKVLTIPAKESKFIALVMKRADYKNRKQRDAESK